MKPGSVDMNKQFQVLVGFRHYIPSRSVWPASWLNP